MSERDSLPEQAATVARAWRVLVPIGVVVMAAATWGASAATTAVGLARKDDVAASETRVGARVDALDHRIGTPVERDPQPFAARLTVLETARVAQVESVGLTIEEVVGLRVALHRTTTVAKLTEAQRTAIDAASVAARAKYRRLVQRTGDVHQSASQVLAEAGVPR